MAIYNADEVMNKLNEQEVEEYDALDNLVEACDAMMDMLMLGEGAYRKYMNMQADKQDEHFKRMEKYSDLYNKTISDNVKNKLARDYKIEKDEARKTYEDARNTKDGSVLQNMYLSGNSASSIRDNLKFDDEYKGGNNGYAHKAKHNWMRDHGNQGEDKLGRRKPGTFKASEGLSKDHEAKDQKKKAIKETCLYILSVIDDM